MSVAARVLDTSCCIVGGGPAGMMLGYLLARTGVEVVVLEKHADFLRDFRGDTIHPSTLEIMDELGLLDQFLKRPHQEVTHIGGVVEDEAVTVADFTHLPTRCKFLAFMPQWDFLDFLAGHARALPPFTLCMSAEVVDLATDAGVVSGVVANTDEGPLTVRAPLVVACDGRGSVVREKAGLAVQAFGVPIDVLWMRISKGAAPMGEQAFGHLANGRIMVTLNRGDYWQCAYIIRKGEFDEVRRRGLDHLRRDVVALAPHLAEHADELADWDQIKLLTVKVDRLRHWHRPGLLCLGDAAHAMSPIGGVGINLAIQDAVAAANLLARSLVDGRVTDDLLARVQRRRLFPTRVTQAAQVAIQDRVFTRVLGHEGALRVPLVVRMLRWWPVLRRIPARVVGLGVRPEHVDARLRR